MAHTSVIWVHGNAVEPEETESLMLFVRKGWGAQCKGLSGTTQWFHFPVCSPSVLEGSPMYLSKLYLMYNTMPGGKVDLQPVITSVHVYDGRTLAMSFDAIPAVMMFNYLTGRVEAFDVEMDNSSSELIDYFLKKRGDV